MSIPLDRLYHYIESLCSDDIIIYRWTPHGSKNLFDLSRLEHFDINKQKINYLTTIPMICHDQEPLTYNSCPTDQVNEMINIQYNSHHVSESAKQYIVTLKQNMHGFRVMTSPLSMYDKFLLCHSEKNSKELVKFEKNGFIGVYYWAHGLIARDWFRYAEHDSSLDKCDPTHDFLIYNRAWAGTREYRLKFAELLVENNLLPYCKTKFNSTDNNVHYTHHQFSNPQFKPTILQLEDFFELNTALSSYSADYNSTDYITTRLEVVLETLFDDSRHHLTEKSLRPIACGKPFILAATPNSLQYLRDYGFKTFNGLINEHYDTIVNPVARLLAIVSELKRLSMLSPTQKKELYNALAPIAQYNKKLFFSKEWEKQLSKEFKNNLHCGAALANAHCTGQHWRDLFTVFADEKGSSPSKKYLDDWLAHRGYKY